MSIRIPVAPAELAKALLVWLRIMPKRVWRDLEAYRSAELGKRHDPSVKPDPEAAVAAHLAGQIERSGWEVTRPEPEAPASPPAWTGEI